MVGRGEIGERNTIVWTGEMGWGSGGGWGEGR